MGVQGVPSDLRKSETPVHSKLTLFDFLSNMGTLRPDITVRQKIPDESAEVYARKRMDFDCNSVVAKSPNFMDFGLSPTNTPDKFKCVIVTTTRVESVTNGSNLLQYRHDIKEFTVIRVSEEKSYNDYIKNESETMKYFERENICRSQVKTISSLKNGEEQFTISTLKIKKSSSPFHRRKT